MPTILKAVEVLGMEQARRWKVATLNEFRKFFNLTPHATFKDINSDEDVAKSLEALYTHPDHVELYPGVIAEESKYPLVPGSGLCPGYTISRIILSDAVALVRGDRFYTVVWICRMSIEHALPDMLTLHRTIVQLLLPIGAIMRSRPTLALLVEV